MSELPDCMKVLIKEEEKPSYMYKEIPVPQPGNGELLVKVLKVSICGSDNILYQWGEAAKAIATLPFIPGHECVGEVVKVGPECDEKYFIGQRICCENHFYCGKCYQCSHDLRHICQNLNQFGHGRGTIYGGCAQYTIIPAQYCYQLKTNLDVDRACLLEPFGVAHQAMEEVCPGGDTVLIQGCGPIGLISAGIAKCMGAVKIIATDIVEERLQKAKQMGADVLVNGKTENLKDIVMRETSGDGIGCLVECSGAAPLVNSCFSLLRKGGRVVLVGLLKQPLHVENFLQDILFKSLTLKTIHGRKIFSTWEKSEELLFNNKVDVTPVITHEVPMSQFEKAFDLLKSGKGCKIMVNPHA
ncbi:uncharacterized protein LOC111321701 isoform X1 [Stylophora pistillata]|uniref:uncharacterized protein LOC111321701 isoform X1 n=1 Tax=Stylophora pistillata TaxID=50429 RepID=UPI000C03B5B5|nr:uncharacterized protein LOC111321701 isoform X1 [Stylophora pistillata]